MKLPRFPECSHPLIQSLSTISDSELLSQFQNYPEQGIYFTAIFCRYSSMTYSLLQHLGETPEQVEYLLGLTWRHIFQELPHLELSSESEPSGNSPTLRNWLIDQTAICINYLKAPAADSIRYSLQQLSPPLWCYLEQALEHLPPRSRLVVLMAQTLQWSDTLIAGYLQAEGEEISSIDISTYLQQGYDLLESTLPKDIRELYLSGDLPDDEAEAMLLAQPEPD